jgi:hypothetical protein
MILLNGLTPRIEGATYYNFPFGVNIKVYPNELPTATISADQGDSVCEQRIVAYIH